MKPLLQFFLSLALLANCRSAPADITGPIGVPFTVHGRLSLYNGTPSFRIWVVGTKRILGVEQVGNEIPLMPIRLSQLVDWQNNLFADFTVVPTTEYETDAMRFVKVIAADNIVITDGRLQLIRRIPDRIEGEPNHFPEPPLRAVH